jgi:exonuclease VII small subunit
MKRGNIAIGFILILILLTINVYALSNESIKARQSLAEIENTIHDLESREIPILRINDTYQKAYQVYQAQVSLEEKNKKGDYTIVLSYSQEMQKIASLKCIKLRKITFTIR